MVKLGDKKTKKPAAPAPKKPQKKGVKSSGAK
jgi:hypothetical protein